MFGRNAAFLFLVPTMLVSRVGLADRIDVKERTARTACLSGDYTKGVQLLSELFVDTEEPAFIYNQGRCFEQNRKYEDAIARFQEYLRAAKKATKGERAEAQKHIDDCEALLAKARAQAAPVVPAVAVTPPSLAPQTASSPATIEAAIPDATTQRNASSKSDRAGMRIAGIVTASVGVASLVAGLVFNLKANSLADEFDSSQDVSTKDRHSSYKAGSMVCYGVGAGAVVAGTLLYILGRSRSETADPISFFPVVTPSEFSLGLRRRF